MGAAAVSLGGGDDHLSRLQFPGLLMEQILRHRGSQPGGIKGEEKPRFQKSGPPPCLTGCAFDPPVQPVGPAVPGHGGDVPSAPDHQQRGQNHHRTAAAVTPAEPFARPGGHVQIRQNEKRIIGAHEQRPGKKIIHKEDPKNPGEEAPEKERLVISRIRRSLFQCGDKEQRRQGQTGIPEEKDRQGRQVVENAPHFADVAVADVIVGLPGDEVVEIIHRIPDQFGGKRGGTRRRSEAP